jgi:CRISPR system Cascade subunit CasA
MHPIGFRPGRGFWRDFAALLPHVEREQGIPPQVVCHACDLYRALGMRDRPPRTLVLGLSNDKAKPARIEHWRAEEFVLPPAILSDPNVYEPIVQALKEAEEGGWYLHRATAVLAEKLLSRTRVPQKSDVRNLALTLPGTADYWTSMEAQFAGFLSSLSADYDADDIAVHWAGSVHNTLRTAWEHTVRATGDDAVALRAIAQAEGVLAPYMAGLYSRIHAEELDN